jgi:Ca2+-binding RTX toxin-like protein
MLLGVLMTLALLLASGVALAATINGTNGADFLVGTRQADTIKGFRGDDIIGGKDGADTLRGYEGNDITDGQAQSDTLTGGPGRDNIITGPGSEDAVFAEDGQQDLICIDPRSGATVESDDDEDILISSNSC